MNELLSRVKETSNAERNTAKGRDKAAGVKMYRNCCIESLNYSWIESVNPLLNIPLIPRNS
jgi:hypothetical protein